MSDADIVALYAELRSALDVGLRANCSDTTVLAIVRAAGGAVKPRGGGTRPARSRAITDEQICERYRAGDSGPALARSAACSVGTIYQVLAANRVPRRNVRDQRLVREARPCSNA